jgi:peptidoglycan/LPS O-acetylase OafA/YrhL
MKPTPTPSTKQYSYRPEIDGIRAFAVTAVIINHFNKEILPSGYLGVDIFFVISGFVITSSLAGRPSKNLGDFLAGFYTRRIKRLVPALVLFVLITSILICLFNPSTTGSLRTGITSLFGLSNLYLLKQSTDYFAASTELNVFTHTWSLGVEEQFYFLFPFLVWFTGFGRLAIKGSRNLFWVMGVLSFASLIAFVYSYKTNQPAAYFLMPTRLWELGAGCLLFLGLKHSNRFLRALEKFPPLIATGAVVAVLFAPLQFAVQATFAIVVLTAVLITCLRSGTAAHNLFTHPRVVYIGLISYSLYLWHWGVLSISRWTIGIHWWSVPFQVALILLLSNVSYRYVETPLRHSNWSAVRWKSIVYGLGACAIAAIFLVSFDKFLSSYLYTGAASQIEKQYQITSRLPSIVTSCNIYTDEVSSLEIASKCGFDNDIHRPTIYLVGDSHIQQFLNPIADYAVIRDANIRSVWGNNCLFPAAVITQDYHVNGVTYSGVNCYERQNQLEKSLIKKVKRGDVVFIGNALYFQFSGNWTYPQSTFFDINGNPLDIKTAAIYYSQHLRLVTDQLVKKGVKVVIFLDSAQFPNLRYSGGELCEPQWFRPFISEDCFISKSNFLEGRDKNFGWIFQWADGSRKFVWDALDPTTCNETMCLAAHYRDSNHFKDYYARYLFSLFIRRYPNLM